MINYEAIGRRIKEERRLNKRISQEAMAADLGLYQADISNLERANKGSGINDLARLDRIAKYFGIPTEELVFGSTGVKSAVHYAARTVRQNTDHRQIPVEHAALLTKAFDQAWGKLTIAWFPCGEFSTYFVSVLNTINNALDFECNGTRDFVLRRMHAYTIHDNRIVASMTISEHNIFHFMNQPILGLLQQCLIPTRVIDVVDIARLINPYFALNYLNQDESRKEEFETKYVERLMQLREINHHPVVLIHSLYVKEAYRQHGIARMLIDAIDALYQKPVLWLNMQPTDDEEFARGLMLSPTCTNFDVGQMSLNAHIAERLGFTVDPDLWHLTMAFENEYGFTQFREVDVLKSAYRLTPNVDSIIANDADLVQIGRAAQKLQQSLEKTESKIPMVSVRDTGGDVIRCPYCGHPLVSEDDDWQPCEHVLFIATECGPEYVRNGLPWTFGEMETNIPLKEGDVAWEEDMSMYEYLCKLEYSGALIYSLEAPEPYEFCVYIALESPHQ